jgi:hypothetical protein
MKILSDLNTKEGREYTLIMTIVNESLHEISNDNGVRVVNFAMEVTMKNATIWDVMP